ncbi:MAG TPA: sigma-70 family RNA polymerase sigma factor [Spirochaetota bacterium]|nr:sigma-70 family RNA polymerase sigma factor [Spirochaetota bacterium]HPJ37030.1 sigma-70 family RNA polymerase sigma factor [Spirochaetota bacterium]HPQ54563.1 sigma-70 family RNA polymerase sigma factor [Spirochaetota bacterium]
MNSLDKKTREFTEVYSDYYPIVYCTVYSKIGNPDDTHDICQEVFIRFYEKFSEVQTPRKWLLGTLRYVILEHLRKKGGTDTDIDMVYNDVSLSFVNGFRDTRIIIEEALEDIEIFGSEKNKLLFDMIAIYNFTYRETGRQLGMTERQVRYQYSIVMKRLIEYFKTKGVADLEDLL